MIQRIFASIIALSLLSTMPAWGQTNNNSSIKKLIKTTTANKNARNSESQTTKNKSSKLSRAILEQATSIVYSDDSGSLPPEYQWQKKITVTKGEVRLRYTREYGEKIVYDKRHKISSSQYQQFINDLSNQGIEKIYTNNEPKDGGGVTGITVRKNGTVLFDGSMEENLRVNKGRLCDAFFKLLTPEMKKQINNIE